MTPIICGIVMGLGFMFVAAGLFWLVFPARCPVKRTVLHLVDFDTAIGLALIAIGVCPLWLSNMIR